MDKKAFVLYADMLSQIEDLNPEQMGNLFKAILVYVGTGETMEMDAVTNMAFKFIRAQIDRDQDKYREKCERNRENAQKRWNDVTAYDRMRTDATVYDGKQSHEVACEPMHTDTDTESDTDTDSDIESKERPKQRFVPPSIADVQNYADSKGLKVDAERFVDFYSSKGWTVGKSPMKDWRAAVRNWASRDRASPKKNNFTVVEGRDNSGKYAALENALLGRAT